MNLFEKQLRAAEQDEKITKVDIEGIPSFNSGEE